jgi:hypothetical protein
LARRNVCVHRCFAAIEPVSIGLGETSSRRIFHHNPNAACGCRYHISFPARDALVAAGEVFVLLTVNSLGHCVPNWRAVVVSAIRPKVPRYQGVEAWRVLKACDSDYERKRIELYGELARFAGEFAWSDEVRERVAAVRATERAK